MHCAHRSSTACCVYLVNTYFGFDCRYIVSSITIIIICLNPFGVKDVGGTKETFSHLIGVEPTSKGEKFLKLLEANHS